LAGAAGAGEAVHVYRPRLHDPVRVERREAEDDADGEAPRVADDAGVRDGLAVQLGDAESVLPEEVGGGVRRITDRGVALRVARVVRGAGEAEISGVVDELYAARVEVGGVLLGDAVRRREDHDVDVLPHLYRVRRVHGEVRTSRKVRVHVRDALPGVVTRDELRGLEVRVLQQELEDAEPAVAG